MKTTQNLKGKSQNYSSKIKTKNVLELLQIKCFTILMKKLLLALELMVFILLPSIAYTQEKTSSEFYQDLLGNYRRYQTFTEPFNTAKSRHQTYKSVSTHAELLKASQDLVSSEIDSILSYTLFIKTLLAEATKVINYHENFLYIKLDDEITFLNQTQKKVNSISSLSETGLLIKDLFSHYQNVSKIGYQIKTIIELGAVNKVFGNVKIDKDKIDNFLVETSFDEAKLLELNAAKEKFSDLNKEIVSIEELMNKAANLQKTEVHDDQKGISEQITKLIEESVVKIKSLISGYKNIVFSLK